MNRVNVKIVRQLPPLSRGVSIPSQLHLMGHRIQGTFRRDLGPFRRDTYVGERIRKKTSARFLASVDYLLARVTPSCVWFEFPNTVLFVDSPT